MQRFFALAIILTIPTISNIVWAEARGGGRPVGFMLDLELGVSTPVLVGFEALNSGWAMRPQFTIGAQIRKIGVGAVLGVGLSSMSEEEEDAITSWAMNFGAALDYEIWSRGNGGLVLNFAIPGYINGPNEDIRIGGFGVEVGFGGRVFFDRKFAVAINFGSLVDIFFWERQSGDTTLNGMTINWSLFGSLSFRFIAA